MHTRIAAFLVRAALPLLAAAPLAAQALPAWTQTIDQSQIGAGDSPWGFVRDPATGRLHVAGWYQTGDAPATYAAFVAAYEASGSVAWSRTIPPAPGRNRFAYRLALHPAGGVVLVGQDTNAQLSDTDVLVARVDGAGALSWAVTWDGPLQTLDDADDLLVEPDGSPRVAARTWSNTAGGLVSVLLMFDANGTNPLSVPVPASGAAAASGGRLARASNGDLFFLQSDRLTRLTPGGAELWSTPSPGARPFARPVVDAQDAVTISMELVLPGDSLPTFHLRRFDAAGTHLWTRSVVEPALPFGMAKALALQPSGLIVAAGFLSSGFDANPIQSGPVVVAFHPDGTEAWRRTSGFAGIHPEGLDLIAAAPNGDVVVQGVTRDAGNVRRPCVVRLGRDGAAVWSHEFDGLSGIAPGAANVGVEVGPDEAVYVATTRVGTSDTEIDGVLTRLDSAAIALCSGDGTSSACPCGNAAPEPTIGGCRNSFGLASRLSASGSTSLANDTWTLAASDLPASTTALFFQGTSAVPGGTAFGDGLRCAGGTVTRLGTRAAVAGAAVYPGPGDAHVSVQGAIGGPGPRWYQVWYRNAAPGFCTSATFNLTNGVRGLWVL